MQIRMIYIIIGLMLGWSNLSNAQSGSNTPVSAAATIKVSIVDSTSRSQLMLAPTVNYGGLSGNNILLGAEDRSFINSSKDGNVSFSYRVNGNQDMNLSINLDGKKISELNSLDGLFSLQFEDGRIYFSFTGFTEQNIAQIPQNQGSLMIIVAAYKY